MSLNFRISLFLVSTKYSYFWIRNSVVIPFRLSVIWWGLRLREKRRGPTLWNDGSPVDNVGWSGCGLSNLSWKSLKEVPHQTNSISVKTHNRRSISMFIIVKQIPVINIPLDYWNYITLFSNKWVISNDDYEKCSFTLWS